MNEAAVRDRWLLRQREDIARANEYKSPQDALRWMIARYRTLTDEERPVVDRVLAEQLGSEDESIRYLAGALVENFRIVSALPALRVLADWLETQQWPGAPYEWAKVNQVIGVLVEMRD